MQFLIASQVLVLVSLVGYAVWVRARRSALDRTPQSGSPRTTAHSTR
jgi:hypothetical protein